MTTPKKNIHQRMVEVMKVVTYIQKEKKSGMQYSIVSHDKVTAKIRPALVEHGITVIPIKCTPSQDGNRTGCHTVTRFTNIDDPSDYIDVETFGYGIDTQDKGPGKAQSYAHKYALLKAFGLETGDDPDLDQQVEYTSEDIDKVEEFIKKIAKAATTDDLAALRDTYAEHLVEATKIKSGGAVVAMAKQKWAAKNKELTPQPDAQP